MEQHHYLKIPRANIFSPKFVRGYSSGNIKNKKIINNFPHTAKFSDNTINYFNSTNIYIPNKSNLYISLNNLKLYTPKRKIPKYNFANLSKRRAESRPRSSSYKKILPSVYNNKNKSISQTKFSLENEKLYYETYQMKQVIKDLEKELFLLSQENLKKDKKIIEKENQINNIINSNKNKYINNDEEKDDLFYNDLNINNQNNSSMGVLTLKIRKEIKNTNNEIKIENNKINNLKKSLFITKVKELNIESKLYKQQFNKLITLMDNALKIKQQNDIKLEEFENLKENINKQSIIISNFEEDLISLQEEESYLNNHFLNLKKELKKKVEKSKKNKKELNILLIKNKNLNNDKVIKSTEYTTKINGTPINVKSIYTNRVSELKKNINFYKNQSKYTDDIINKLKDQKKKLIDNNKNMEQKIKIIPTFIEGSSKIKKFNRPISSLGKHSSNSSLKKDEDIINILKKKYKSIRENEITLHQKVNTYFEKLKEIDVGEGEKEKNEEEKEEDQNQIEFGIDENNPYYTDNEENVPESHIKFTSSQFNQFTYILFKNFEAKFIVSDEANNKIIKPFKDLTQKLNITKVDYPSNEFDTIIEEFTKVIMNVLNSDNEYNHTLTKMFIGALLYNSECDTNKLIEYFSILFSYTRNYIEEENKLIEKLKNKYKNQTKKLVECITSYILNDLSSSPYFSLFKMKDLLDKNEINLKDKYIEFLFYYMKKFNDPDAKLEDLKFSLLNDIVPIGDTTVHSKAFIEEDIKKNIDNNLNNENNIKMENKNTDIGNIDESNEEDIKKYENKKNKEKNRKNKSKEKDKKNKRNKSKNSSKSKSKSKSKDNINNSTDNNKNKSKSKSKNNIENNTINNDESKDNKNIDINKEINKKDKESPKMEQKKDIINNNDININNKDDNNINNDNNIINDNNDIKKEEILNEDIDKKEKDEIENYENNVENKIKEENIKNKTIDKYNEDEYIIESNNNEKLKNIENNETNKDKNKEDEKTTNNNNIINNNEEKNSNNADDSVTEITNEEYSKQIIESINLIQKALQTNSTDFNILMTGVINNNLINGETYEYINIEDFNEKILSVGVTLTDLQLSCLCSKYCVPNELRLIDKQKFEKSLEDNLNGNLKIE